MSVSRVERLQLQILQTVLVELAAIRGLLATGQHSEHANRADTMRSTMQEIASWASLTSGNNWLEMKANDAISMDDTLLEGLGLF